MPLSSNAPMATGLIILRGECEKEMTISYLKRVNVDYLLCLSFCLIEELVSCPCLHSWSWQKEAAGS